MSLTNIGRRIRFYREKRGLTEDGLAQMVNLSQSQINRIENAANTSTENIAKIAKALDVPEYNFFSEKPLILKSEAEKEPAILEVFQDEATKLEYDRFETRDDFIPIRIIGHASLGQGRIITTEESEGYALIYKYALKKKAWNQSRKSEKVVCIKAEGNSMEPTIQSGSIVALDVEDMSKTQKRKIYAIEIPDEGVTIKRVIEDKHHFMLFADNPNYPGYPKCINKKQCGPNPIRGKVIWAWSKLD